MGNGKVEAMDTGSTVASHPDRIGRVIQKLIKVVQKKYERLAERDDTLSSFEVCLLGQGVYSFGRARPAFRITLKNKVGMRALISLDETSIGQAYMNGDIDVDGEFIELLRMRPMLSDNHPFSYFWHTYIHPLIFGQVFSDKKWISQHYDEDPNFYTLWLDKTRCYSQGVFEKETESLEKAMKRKMDYAIASCKLKAGNTVLDIGGGWGSLPEYAGKKGIKVTSLTISRASEDFINRLIEKKKLPCRVVYKHLLEYDEDIKYDAIINMGVTEHLPDYKSTLKQYQRYLKPGGRVYLDASAGRARYISSSMVYKNIYPGNATTLCLHDYLEEVAQSAFEVQEVINDRKSYAITSKKWAKNMARVKGKIVEQWGEFVYRKFNLFHWGCAYAFDTNLLTAYRVVLHLPEQQSLIYRLDTGKEL